MRILRFSTDEQTPRFGWIHQDKIGEIEGNVYESYRRYDLKYSVSEVKILPPCLPSKIICVGRNYADHAKEQNAAIPDIPILFLKPPSSIIATNESIILPPQSNQVEHEAELAVVIKKTCRWLKSEDVKEYIFGYTIANDVTARDIQRQDVQWTRGKGFDTFCPLGPWIETEFILNDALITCHVDGQLRQMGTTRDMLFSVTQLISFISSTMTLYPGDIILTGTPSGVGLLDDGNLVSVNIEGIGTLTNPVKRL
jgi:2-keto-4-pentenoate hydratase/2-oxohepta-3-ene-1,7-dioic acid hydratase in catechol pathway